MSSKNYFFTNYTNTDDKLVTDIYQFKKDNGYSPTVLELQRLTGIPLKQLMNKIEHLEKRHKKVTVVSRKDGLNMRVNV